MPELRHDPFQRRWVIIATERTRRPQGYARGPEALPRGGFCPFCPGNESSTPPEIRSVRDDGSAANGPGWKLRVIPNKFPALRVEGELEREGVGLFDRMSGVGAHEVIVDGPEHSRHLADMSYGEIERVIDAASERLRDLQRDHRLKYVLIFKNHGEAAGASLAHPHTQIIATPVTPRTVAAELEAAQAHFRAKERCLYCDVLSQEVKDGSRIVRVDSSFVVLTPYASRFPFELMVLPRKHSCTFGEMSADERSALARALRDTLRRLKVALDDPPFNFMIHTSPNLDYEPARPFHFQTLRWDYHWHMEIIPRLTRVAGFEWGTGFYINPTPPEDAAAFLRQVDIEA
ncbi:galactose-1-phosphate uridylyltransferase [bacterium]|nr:galactose-1-phosphate uridylyltransferase [bacterium]